MPTVTVHFGGICTFFMADVHREQLDGFRRVVLVNASEAQTIDGEEILPHVAQVQIGGEPPVAVQGLHMRLLTPNVEAPLLTVFAEKCPNLTLLTLEDEEVLSRPSQQVVFAGDRQKAALYFDFKAGTLEPTLNDLDAVVTTLVVQGDEVVLETSAFNGAPAPPEPLAGRVFLEDTTIWVSNDDTNEPTSKYDFYLHYLTAEQMPKKPGIPKEPPSNLPVVRRLPHWFGAIGAGCSNSTYP